MIVSLFVLLDLYILHLKKEKNELIFNFNFLLYVQHLKQQQQQQHHNTITYQISSSLLVIILVHARIQGMALITRKCVSIFHLLGQGGV